jgi:hypothetical protein
MKSNKYKLSRVWDEAAIPAGWVQNFKNNPRSHRFSHFVVRAVDAGKVRCVCYGGATKTCAGGKYFIHPEDMKLLEQEWDERECEMSDEPASEQNAGIGSDRLEAAVVALCEINNGITLMQATLERLTTAVESIATQPKTAQQELLNTVNGNGFYS